MAPRRENISRLTPLFIIFSGLLVHVKGFTCVGSPTCCFFTLPPPLPTPKPRSSQQDQHQPQWLQLASTVPLSASLRHNRRRVRRFSGSPQACKSKDHAEDRPLRKEQDQGSSASPPPERASEFNNNKKNGVPRHKRKLATGRGRGGEEMISARQGNTRGTVSSGAPVHSDQEQQQLQQREVPKGSIERRAEQGVMSGNSGKARDNKIRGQTTEFRQHKVTQQQQQQQQQQRYPRRRRRGGEQGGGAGIEDDETWMTPAERERETRAVEVAKALAVARRGTGERERLIECEAPVEEFVIRGRRVLVKRDDKMRLAGSGLSGNKARKLYAINKTPADAFPKVVASHGGVQSNAMVAIAAVVATKPGSKFVYYTKPVGKWLRKNAVGNFARAMALGAEIMEVHPTDYERVFGGLDGPGFSRYSEVVPDGALFLPQGGADAGAEEGVSMLADEITDYWDANGPPGKELKVIVPAGTGTTALFLARHLKPAGIGVCAVPCAGDGAYLLRQMTKVDRASGGVQIFPEIVAADKKAAFGVPRQKILEIWRELDELGLFVDLLYAAPTWEVIMDEWNKVSSPFSVTPGRPDDDTEPQLMYVHCGGLEGVSSQLTRYKHQGLVEDRQLQ